MRIGYSEDFGVVDYNLGRNQQNLANSVKQLSSGLRINSAADDPSGLAIAESLRSVTNGLQQGAANVQTASNALTVADSSLATITTLLQRMRSLVVEANSDLNTASNLSAIQTEIDQLTTEINRVAANANFNGLHLLDGSLASRQVVPAGMTYVQNPSVGSPSAPLIDPSQTTASPYTEPAQFSFSVDSYDANTNELQVTFTVSSPSASFGPPQVTTLHVTPGTNYFVEYGPGVGPYTVLDQNNNPILNFNFNSISATDVGKEAIVVTTNSIPAFNGHPLEVNTGTNEGTTLAISIDGMSAYDLGVSETTVGDMLMNQASEARLDGALDTVTGERAQIGAQIVALNAAVADNNTQIVNQIASESSIRDLNIAAATTEFTKEQILSSVGTSVLSQMEVSTQQLTTLVVSALGRGAAA